MKKRVFVTGGFGYVGSHTCTELLKAGHDVLVYDDLSNATRSVLDGIVSIAIRSPEFIEGDILDALRLRRAMSEFNPDLVVHFAGLKSVVESVRNPLRYYDVNVYGSMNVLRVMDEIGCETMVFSSSATVYGSHGKPPFKETHQVGPTSPYGKTKLVVEEIISDWVHSSAGRKGIALRYFNPVGAHESGLIGEAPQGSANNIMPILMDVATNPAGVLEIYGSDYETRDGTGERDFIHVVDLAKGHVDAVEKLSSLRQFQVLNLGTGSGTTVLELVDAFKRVSGLDIKIRLTDRRSGDVAESVADPSLASELLNLECHHSVDDMCRDAWNWHLKSTSSRGL